MIFDPILDIFRGKAITVPPLDGAFRPNTALDEAPLHNELDAVDNLCLHDGKVLASSGATLFALTEGSAPEQLETFPAEITALASDGTSLAVALDDGSLIEDGTPAKTPDTITCITALAYAPDGTLWLTNGSDRHKASAWVVDLMEKNAAGSLWRRAPDGAFESVASGLAWPNGLLPRTNGVVAVSESWKHRLIRVENGKITPILRHLPGYPARLAPSHDGGAWLALFAPRNRLVELVLQEKHYRFDMMESIPPDYWIAPALSSGNSFLEPLQCGAIRTMGIHKPWSPTRSYGLVARLDENMVPTYSLHSRADGQRHGVCSLIEENGKLLVGVRGGNCILAPDTEEAK